jgi:hypothetical protein
MMLRKLAAVLPIQAKPSAAEILLQKPTPKPPKKVSLVQKLLKFDKPKPQVKPLVKTGPRLPPLQPAQPQLLPKPAPTSPAPAPQAPPKPQDALRQAHPKS